MAPGSRHLACYLHSVLFLGLKSLGNCTPSSMGTVTLYTEINLLLRDTQPIHACREYKLCYHSKVQETEQTMPGNSAMHGHEQKELACPHALCHQVVNMQLLHKTCF